jgi:hypothetical protein
MSRNVAREGGRLSLEDRSRARGSSAPTTNPAAIAQPQHSEAGAFYLDAQALLNFRFVCPTERRHPRSQLRTHGAEAKWQPLRADRNMSAPSLCPRGRFGGRLQRGAPSFAGSPLWQSHDDRQIRAELRGKRTALHSICLKGGQRPAPFTLLLLRSSLRMLAGLQDEALERRVLDFSRQFG